MMVRDDGLTNSYVSTGYNDPQDTELPEIKGKANRLDSAAAQKLLSVLMNWRDQEWERQAHNRFQMAMDEDYYDGLQWLEDDAAELMARGQAPVVYNEIKPTIDWLIGTERRTRIDYKVLPRRKNEGKQAEAKTSLMKYLSDVNKEPFARSRGFASSMKGGLGWLEVGLRDDPTDEPIFYRDQSWRFILHDSSAVEYDLSDARFIFRWKYLDQDVAEAIFSDRKDVIRRAVIDGESLTRHEMEDELWYMGARVTEAGQDYAPVSASKYHPYDGSAFAHCRRPRAKVFECWYRKPVVRKRFSGGDFRGEYYDKRNNDHKSALQTGASLYDRIEMEVRVALFCDAGLLWESESPFNHDRFPFVPIWAYRRSRDNAPYSPIRGMRDSQDSINKRGSKALWIVSTNQITMDKGAVDDVDELREEAARPDGIIQKNPGKELVINRDLQLADQHLKLMDRDMVYIRNGGGVTEENLGRQTNANSGKAIIARQEQGGVITTELFDNLRFAIQLAGEIELSLIEQTFTEEKTVRLIGDRGQAKFVDINTQDPETGEIINDITSTQADFRVSEQDYRDSLRIAMFESLFDIVARLAQMSPETALKLLDLVVDMADIPNRDEIVARIRQINGMRDPDTEPTPEELEAEQKARQLEEMNLKIAIEKANGELRELAAKGEKLTAEALNHKLQAFRSAFEAAGLVISAPALAPVADDLMASAGFEDATPEDGLAGTEVASLPAPVDIFEPPPTGGTTQPQA